MNLDHLALNASGLLKSMSNENEDETLKELSSNFVVHRGGPGIPDFIASRDGRIIKWVESKRIDSGNKKGRYSCSADRVRDCQRLCHQLLRNSGFIVEVWWRDGLTNRVRLITTSNDELDPHGWPIQSLLVKHYPEFMKTRAYLRQHENRLR